MPTPHKGEKEKDYVSRCIPVVLKEGTAKDSSQAAAICHSMYKKHRAKSAVAGAMSSVSQATGGALVGPPSGARKKLRRKDGGVGLLRNRPSILTSRKSHKDIGRFSYKLAEDGAYGLDHTPLSDGDFKYDDERMSITVVFAASQGRDREGDFTEVEGILTENHQRTPVAFIDHGKWYRLPIGKCVDPDGNYTVKILPERGLAVAEIFLDRSGLDLVPRQVFELYKQGILRAGSIGYRPLEVAVLPADPAKGIFKKGLHLKKTELLEVSIVGLPMNADAAIKAMEKYWACEPLAPSIKSMWDVCIGGDCARKSKSIVVAGEVPQMPKKTKAYMDSSPAAGVGGGTMSDEPGSAQGEGVPHGAQFAADLHAGLKGLKALIDSHLPRTENKAIKSLAEAVHESLGAHMSKLSDCFKSEYADLEGLEEEEDDDAEAVDQDEEAIEADEEQDAEERAGEPDDGQRKGAKVKHKGLCGRCAKATKGAIKTKRFTKGQHASIKDAAEFLTEHGGESNLTKSQKYGVLYHAKALSDLCVEHEGKDESEASDGELDEDGAKMVSTMLDKLGKRMTNFETKVAQATGQA